VTDDARFDVAVVGAGVVGTAIARQLARYRLRAVVLERSDDVGTGTSKANTAILHTGFDTEPGSLESRLVRRGHGLLAEYADRSGIALERTGALVVAWDRAQAGRLDGVVARAHANGYLPAHRLAVEELYRREPHLGPGATGAVAVPDEWVICPWTTSLAFATEAVTAGVELRLGTEVTAVAAEPGGWRVATSGGPVRADWVVNAAGLDADRLDRQFGHDRFTVTPRRGQLLVFDKLARPLLSSILLPVPTERTKGVLVAPTVYGNLLLGPTAEDLIDRTDTATTAEGVAGLLAAGARILPRLLDEEVTAAYAGLRAATEHRDYQIAVDADRHYVCVGGIRSTGLTASLAIAEHVLEGMADAGFDRPAADEEPAIPRMPPLAERGMRPYQDSGSIAADPANGRIVCFCERVTSGEVARALTSPIPPVDLGGLRRRTRATNGRCQGFFCGAAMAARLAAADR
jgi:glycerol-3-phosphate dehydrogenase